MADKTWTSIDFVNFLGLGEKLTPLEIEDLTDSLHREVLYRALKDGAESVPDEIIVEVANEAKKEFILNYLKDIQEQYPQREKLQKIVREVVVDLSSQNPDFDLAAKKMKIINELLLQFNR